MPDHPDDAQKQRKSTVLPPFFAPRQTRPTTPAAPVDTPRRRASQLFTPPGVARQPRVTTPVTTPAAPPSPPVRAEPEPPPPPPPETRSAADDALQIERSDHVQVSLSSEARTPTPGDVPVVAVDHATSLLESQRRGEEARAADDALEIEATEWTIETAEHPEKLQVESFWAAEPLGSSTGTTGDGYDASDHAPGEAPTAMLELSTPAEELAALEAASREAERLAAEMPSVESAPDSTAAEAAPPIRGENIPTTDVPPPVVEPAEGAETGASVPGNVEALLAAELEAETPAPPWAAGGDIAATEESPVPPAPPRTTAAEDEMTAALAWPEAVSPAESAVAEPPDPGAAMSPEALGDALRASAAAWSRPGTSGVAAAEAQTGGIAAALERIAQRVRSGEVAIADDAGSLTDEGALAVTLAALLRGGSRR